MNPCPCGYLGDSNGRCRCSPERVLRYRSRISGPLLDRLDMHIELARVPIEALRAPVTDIEPSSAVASRVTAAREIQMARQGTTNGKLLNRQIEKVCRVTRAAASVLEKATVALGLSARAHHRILKVARTIADLAGMAQIETAHIGEAVALRRLDRVRVNAAVVAAPAANE